MTLIYDARSPSVRGDSYFGGMQLVLSMGGLS